MDFHGAARMIPDLDICRSAKVIINQYGLDAPIEAAMRADAMFDAGDLGVYAVWNRIQRPVAELKPRRSRDRGSASGAP